MDKPIFEPGKEYRTRDGRRARVYATDGSKEYPIHGAVFIEGHPDGGNWYSQVWNEHGLVASQAEERDDLMPPEPAKERFLLWGAPSATGRDTVLEVEIQPDGTLKAVR